MTLSQNFLIPFGETACWFSYSVCVCPGPRLFIQEQAKTEQIKSLNVNSNEAFVLKGVA